MTSLMRLLNVGLIQCELSAYLKYFRLLILHYMRTSCIRSFTLNNHIILSLHIHDIVYRVLLISKAVHCIACEFDRLNLSVIDLPCLLLYSV